MAIRLLLFAYRKPGLTPTQFKSHYESIHVPLIKRLSGADFPAHHSRRYLARSERPDSSGLYPASIFVGGQDRFGYDAICELVFSDQEALQKFHAKTSTPDAKAALEADEKSFLDREKLKIVMLGDYQESG